jgi:hypothetical protein
MGRYKSTSKYVTLSAGKRLVINIRVVKAPNINVKGIQQYPRRKRPSTTIYELAEARSSNPYTLQ